MADQKVTDLVEEVSPALSDLFYMVDDPGGSPVSKKVTMQNVLDIVNFVGFHATMSGGQVIAAGAVPPIEFDVETYDIGSYFNTANYRWTPPAGYVVLYTSVHFDSSAVSEFRAFIYKNGAEACSHVTRPDAAVGTGSSCSVAWVGVADGDDYFESRIYHIGGSGKTAGPSFCYFMGFLIPQS